MTPTLQKTATIVHLDGLDGVTPLVGGYLKAFALADPEIRRNWRIELYSETCRVKASRVIRDLVQRSPDVVAFSVYTWNAGLVARILPALRGLLPPTTHFLLGGVEVVNVAPRHVDPAFENVAVCNGEGERTFRDLLLELGTTRPELANVGGITFPREGQWHTTPGQPRIKDLTELPSPWLTGVFDDWPTRTVALFETNRGCPFFCEFCFWGGATGQKVHRQELDRLKEELTWIARQGYGVISLCDANFGIFPRDVELAEHIAAESRRNRGPGRILFNSSKVHPERVELISQILGNAGLLTRHVFSLQSMNEHALKVARRTSLERGPYEAIQRRLNEKRLPSLIELLWPMPGETLESFKEGVDLLCRLGAQTFLIYPLIWLNNTGYAENTEQYGVTTLPEDDPAGGGKIVVQTREVDFEQYLEGLRFTLALYLLHDCRGLFTTMQILNALGVVRFRDAVDTFAQWMDEQASGPIAQLWSTHLECFEDMAKINVRGILADAVLHDHRQAFDRLLADFVAAQPSWTDHAQGELVEAAVEFDLLHRPYMFLQTPFELGVELRHMRLVQKNRRLFRVRSPYDLAGMLDGLRVGRALEPADLERRELDLTVDHRRHQLVLLPSRTEDERQWLCTLAVQEIARIEPECSVETPD